MINNNVIPDIAKNNIDILKSTKSNTYGDVLLAFYRLSEFFFPGRDPDIPALLEQLDKIGVAINKSRLYEYKRQLCVLKQPWFHPGITRSECRAYAASQLTSSTPPSSSALKASPELIFELAIKLASQFQIAVNKSEFCPYIINLTSIRKNDPKQATTAFAMILAVPVFSGGQDIQHSTIEMAHTWGKPILTDTPEHMVIELANELGYTPAWALTSASRLFYESYIDNRTRGAYLALMRLK